jgi:PST family polysaccharide transporter
LIAIIGFLLAPYIAGFFSKKIQDVQVIRSLIWMIRILALSQLTYVLIIVPSRVLDKELRFKESVIAGIFGTLAYGVTALVLAFLGFGAWAIILAQITNMVISRIIIFSYSPFIPSFIFNIMIAKKYLVFGVNNFINSIVGIVVTNGDDTLIGRLIGAAALGFYSLGQHFAALAVSTISGVINGVMFPVFSKIQDRKEEYERAFFKAFRLTNLLVIPAIGGAVILANEIVILFFGEKWLPIVPIFYVLSIPSFLNNIIGLAGPVLNSLNKPHLLRNNKLIQFGFFLVLIYPFTKMWGTLGVCYVMVIFSLVSIAYLTPILAKEIPKFYLYIFKVLAKVLPCTLIMMAVVYFVKKIVPTNFFWLFALVILGVVIYFIPIFFLDKDLKWDVQEGLGVLEEKLSFLRR